MIHKLKTWPQYFRQVRNGNKPFEVRLNDRNYQVGDGLILVEYDPDKGYTGNILARTVPYILAEPPFVPDGYVIMALKEDEVAEFVGEYIPRSLLDKWNMTTGENKPQVMRRGGSICSPQLVPENSYYCGQGDLRWAWV